MFLLMDLILYMWHHIECILVTLKKFSIIPNAYDVLSDYYGDVIYYIRSS